MSGSNVHVSLARGPSEGLFQFPFLRENADAGEGAAGCWQAPSWSGAILGLEPRPGHWASNPDRGALRRRS